MVGETTAHTATDPTPAPTDSESVTTHAAARLLGVAITTVLNMIERGQLPAWRTPGGHRRIARSDIDRALANQHRAVKETRDLRLLVVDDDEFLLEAYRGQITNWNLPIDLRLCMGGVQAMLEIGRAPPDLLVTDLRMPGIDGFGVVRALSGDPRYADIDIVVISGLSADEIAKAGGLPNGIVHWAKPIPFALLRGYLDARLSRLAKEASP